MYFDYDEELLRLQAHYQGRWDVSRFGRTNSLVAALEPGRGYRIVAGNAEDLAESIGRYEKNGYLVR
jgi:hypothetical protein